MINIAINLARRIKNRFFGFLSAPANENAVNHMTLDSSDEAIQRDAEYAIIVAKAYMEQISKHTNLDLYGKHVLEIGPGHNFGSGAILMCYGAKLSVADRWLPPFSLDYHPKFYRTLAALINKQDLAIDTSPLERLALAQAHSDLIDLYPDAEMLDPQKGEIFDYIVSNAVFEHLIDAKKACANLAALSKPNSYHFHQIDLRDHRDFERPLEYLLMSPKEYAKWLKCGFGHNGSTRRRFEYEAAFVNAGFEILEIEVNGQAKPEYLNDFIPRLRAAKGSKYRNLEGPDLSDIGVRYYLRKPKSS